ncbi:hypothetical protein CSKR_202935 [Clonorchis sinensis]|uniref:Uncharacterized protein n=1 Tax=Clonorchis sinensis TaxID=79923 RepID=A0A8T1M5N7_CLOSI|nr:hypothetical protein CSKR_202935 [Clonorchis sinensis]
MNICSVPSFSLNLNSPLFSCFLRMHMARSVEAETETTLAPVKNMMNKIIYSGTLFSICLLIYFRILVPCVKKTTDPLYMTFTYIRLFIPLVRSVAIHPRFKVKCSKDPLERMLWNNSVD